MFEARVGADEEGAANKRDESAPVAIGPLAEGIELENEQDRAEESPAWREPAVEHPESGGVGEGHG